MPISKASRMYTGTKKEKESGYLVAGPQVQGCRPVLVTFESFKDREDVLKNSKVLRRSAVTVTEDLSKRYLVIILSIALHPASPNPPEHARVEQN